MRGNRWTQPQNSAPKLAPSFPEYNRAGCRLPTSPMPRPKVNGITIDFHCHLWAARHARTWFETASHFGIDCFRHHDPLGGGGRPAAATAPAGFSFIAVPQWLDKSPNWVDNWLRRLEAFYNLGSRIVKFHVAPGTLHMRGVRLDSPIYEPAVWTRSGRGKWRS